MANINYAAYFWTGKEVITVSTARDIKSVPKRLISLPCVEVTRFGAKFYGSLQKINGNTKWISTRIADLPPEFRANILLMGIT